MLPGKMPLKGMAFTGARCVEWDTASGLRSPSDGALNMSEKLDAVTFVELWTQNDRRVFTYILALISHWSDAEEILQETGKFAWENFDSFQEGTSFLSWARSIAYYKVLDHRRSVRQSRMVLGEAAMERINALYVAEVEKLDRRFDALPVCIEQLPSKYREVIELRYRANATVESIAAKMDRTPSAVYKLLNKIHGALLRCVEREFVKECRP
jgi:RNA polymerase sigma-70 factor (ECF subfamily)